MSRVGAVMSGVVLALAAPACGKGQVSPDAGVDANAGTTFTCEGDPRVTPYAPNLLQPSKLGDLRVTLMQSAPAPPARGTNTWMIQVRDSAGNPMPDLSVDTRLFMPDHGHAGTVRPVISPHPDGTYSVDPVYFFMGGVWQVTFTFHADGGADDPAVFTFCVPG